MKNQKPSFSKNQLNKVTKLYSDGHYADAIIEIKSLNKQFPNVPLLFNLIGACYKELGHLEGSAQMFKNATQIKDDYSEAHFNLGVVLKELGQSESAINSYKKAISINPNYPDAYNNLGTLLNDLGHTEAAVESLEWAIAYKHDFSVAHNNLGNALSDLGNVADAVKSFEQAILLNPKYANAYYNLAIAHNELGNKDLFFENIKKAVSLKPLWGDASLQLCRIMDFSKDDPVLLKMHSVLDNEDLPLIDRIGFNFALAHAYEKLNNTGEQFKFLNEANKLRKNEANYSFDQDKKRFARIKKIFKSFSAEKIPSYKKSEIKPIFILGMPRSGTSLVHQIIGSHKEVYGAGELNILSKIINKFIRDSNNEITFAEQEISSIRVQYIDFISSLNKTKKIIIDKMPLNFRHIGFILMAIPEAKIIHMNRDPMATCWSIYKYYFNGNYYSYNQKDLANYYLIYKDLMNYWHTLFPNKIYDICYEDLTTNQEEETRKLLEYCELEWDDNCLNFHKNKGVVKTTSTLQVRQKMYQGSSEVWKKYEDYLQPLIKGLKYYE